MANSIGPNAGHSIRPRLLEQINGMTENQCQELFEKMQAMIPEDKWEYPGTAYSTETNKERRSVPRVDFKCPVYIEGISGQKTITDLSTQGAFVECDTTCKRKFSSGELIRLTIKHGREDVIQVQAQIVNFSDAGMHCMFAHLDRKTADTIHHWLGVA